MKITPELIPHEDFHRVSWLCSPENPMWYYYYEKREQGNVITNKSFLSSVDGPLREFVKFLHKKNIFTTPSCSGHNKSVKEFEKIYFALKKDQQKINHKGILLQDIETGEPILFCDENYCLPWSENEFIFRGMLQQKKGIIGLHLNSHSTIKEKIMALNFKGVKIYEKDAIVFITTQDSLCWYDVAASIKKIIQTYFFKGGK